MKLLLDTHVVVWWSTGSSRVPMNWVEAIVDPANDVAVSAATAWEIEIKKRAGKLDFPRTALEVATENRFGLLPISFEASTLAGQLDWDHRDPFDRMLAAQSIEHGLTIVTSDRELAGGPGVRTL